MWKDYQKELDKTNAWNRHNGKVIEGESRAIYDLAILMNNYVKYAKKVEKDKERSRRKREKIVALTIAKELIITKLKQLKRKMGLVILAIFWMI